MKFGKLIVVEGIDGAGKTTVCSALAVLLEQQGYQVVKTREPGGTSFGKKIREFILEHNEMSARAEFLLFAADRAEHIEKVVRPALASGTIVISDRMSDSSIVYQGMTQNLDLDGIKFINQWAMNSLKADATIYLKIDVNSAQQRLTARGKKTRFESSEMLEQVSNAFDKLFVQRADVITVDAHKSTTDIIKQVAQQLVQRKIIST